MRRLLPPLVATALISGGIVLALAVAEIGFRAYYFFHPPAAKTFYWVPSLEYGWGLAPGREGPFFSDDNEFHTRPRINSHGLRDVEHDYQKSPGVFRILILGDSYMEALQVDLEQMFARQLEQDLRQRGARRVEVINTGVSSWGTDNELLFLQSEGYKYHPDLVLLSFTTANDIRENYLAFNQMAMGANLTKPHFTLDAHGALQKHPPAVPPVPPMPWWRAHLQIGQYLYLRLGGQVFLPKQRQVGIPPPSDPHIPYVPADMLVYKPDAPPEVQEAVKVTKALILAVRQEAASHGARLGVMVHNGPWAYDDYRWRFMCMRNPEAARSWDRQKPNREFDAFLTEQHIPFVDLYADFESAAKTQALFFKIDPHWTAAGHALAADVAARFLIDSGLVPTMVPGPDRK